MPRRLASIGLLLSALLLPLLAQGQSAAETRAKLDELRDRIEAVRSALAKDRQRHDEASEELARVERKLGRLAGDVADLDQRIRATHAKLERLDERRRDLHERLREHRATLAAQLRAAYRLGRQPAIRLLLRQNDPAAVARALGYYGYLNNARLAAIDKARGLIAELGEVAEETRAAQDKLSADRSELAQRREELEGARSERRALLARLERAIEDKDARLQRMEASRDQLEQLLEKLGSVLADIPAAPLEEKPFASRRGELSWPVQGPLRARYGAPRASGRMRWRGVVIDADGGTDVRAVYYGRVVFADWLSGFGQLIIIDHLDGYMSLYGYNRRLLRTTGDWVAPGEVIAAVGDSGGREHTGLYFEIRRKGQPVDPLRWLASR